MDISNYLQISLIIADIIKYLIISRNELDISISFLDITKSEYMLKRLAIHAVFVPTALGPKII